TTVDVHEAGQMPSPVVLMVKFAPTGAKIAPMKNAKMLDSTTALVTWPVDVWFNGKKDFMAKLTFGTRKIDQITFDPYGRFPDCDPSNNVWNSPSATKGGQADIVDKTAPATGAAAAPAGAGRGGRGGGGGGGRGRGGAGTCVQ